MCVYEYIREVCQDETWSSGSKIHKTTNSVLTALNTLNYIRLRLKLERYTKYIGIGQKPVNLSRGANIYSGYRNFGQSTIQIKAELLIIDQTKLDFKSKKTTW